MKINGWCCNECGGNPVVSEIRPDGATPCCGAEFSPVVSAARVLRDGRYRPYHAGSPAWRAAANNLLADKANYIFRK